MESNCGEDWDGVELIYRTVSIWSAAAQGRGVLSWLAKRLGGFKPGNSLASPCHLKVDHIWWLPYIIYLSIPSLGLTPAWKHGAT